MAKIYFVEDDVVLANTTAKYLMNDGHEVFIMNKAKDALLHINDSDVDLWILDIVLDAETNGFDLIKGIHASHPNVPTIFTSSRSDDFDVILGLEFGSDDYLKKPYSFRELTLRVDKILNRSKKSKISSEPIVIGKITINPLKHTVTDDGESVDLTSKEYEILYYFATHRKEKITRDDLINAVWKGAFDGSIRVVDDLMRRLRNKLPNLKIETLYGEGYRIL